MTILKISAAEKNIQSQVVPASLCFSLENRTKSNTALLIYFKAIRNVCVNENIENRTFYNIFEMMHEIVDMFSNQLSQARNPVNMKCGCQRG